MRCALLLTQLVVFALSVQALPRSRDIPDVKWRTLDGKPTVLMGHRGEKTLMPEHTLASYEIAAIENVEYVEPDLVLTKDGVLVCNHDLTLRSTTNILDFPEFTDRMTTLVVPISPNGTVTISNNWFISNFTLLELKTLTIHQANVGVRPQLFNNLFQIATFDEYLETIHALSYKMNKSIGIIPELKHPYYHNLNSPDKMETELLSKLTEFGYPIRSTDAPKCKAKISNEEKEIQCGDVIIQSFEAPALQYLAQKTDIDLMMLVDIDIELLTFKGIEKVSGYAKYFGVWKEFLNVGVEAQIGGQIPYDPEYIESLGGFIPADQFAEEAHKLDLKMCIYTIYDSREPSLRGCAVKCSPEDKEEELYSYFRMGVDGMFVENIVEASELRLRFDYELKIEQMTSSTSTLSTSSALPSFVNTFKLIMFMIVGLFLNLLI